MHQGGASSPAIGRTMGIPARTVRVIIARYRANPDSVRDRPRSGRPRVTRDRDDRVLTRDGRRNRFQTSETLRYREGPWRLHAILITE